MCCAKENHRPPSAAAVLPRSLRNDTASAVVTETGCIDMPQTPLSWIGCRSFRIAAESGEIAGRRGEEGTEATETACLEMIKTTGSLPRVGFVLFYGSQTPSFIVTARVKNIRILPNTMAFHSLLLSMR